ncbi:hypothetical protein D9758_008348 [Tetrapyrgos nigripes]|uniref:Spindle assembly checkpoint component MAD1 n=1 Tax=Tetrapyrgos nigripes TaxID=182062 RepID=A0A8H5GDX9_9AGAR|nr:hypothetical protein D9758_008348 [Tetrapyrgos nigripes]
MSTKMNGNPTEKDLTTTLRPRSILERTNSGSIGTARSSASKSAAGGVNASPNDSGSSFSRPSSSLSMRSGYRTGSTLGLKRDSVQAELEENLLQSKRHLNTTLSAASLERELATTKTRLTSCQKTLSEKEAYISQLELDRRHYSDLNATQATVHEEEKRRSDEEVRILQEKVKLFREAKVKEEMEKRDCLEKLEVVERERRNKAGVIESLRKELDAWKNLSRQLENEVEEFRRKEKERQLERQREEEEREFSGHSTSLDASVNANANGTSPGEETVNAQEIYRSELTHQASSLRSLESTITNLRADMAILKSENQTLKERYGDTPGLWNEIGVLREENRSLEVKLKRKEEDVERLIREGERTVLEISTNSLRGSVRGGSIRGSATLGPTHADMSAGMITPAPRRIAPPSTNIASTSKRNIITPTTTRTQPGSLMSRSMKSKKGRSMVETPLKGRGGAGFGFGFGAGSVLNEPREGTRQQRDGEEMTLDELTTSTPRGGGGGAMPASTSALGGVASSIFGSGPGSSSDMAMSRSMASVLEENEQDEVDELQSSGGQDEDVYDRGTSEAPVEDEEVYEDPPSIHTTADLLALRLEHAKLVDEHGETKAALLGMKRKCERLEGEVKELREKVGEDDLIDDDDGKGRSKMREENLGLKMRLRTMEDEVKGAKGELAFVNQVLAQYQADEKAKRTTASSSAPVLDEVTSARLSRLNELEAMYAESKTANSNLRSQLDTLQSKLDKAVAELQRLTQENAHLTKRLSPYESSSSPTLQSLQESLTTETNAKESAQSALAAAEKQVEDHLKKIEDLEQQLFELGGEIAGGRHVPPNVRVLQMADNPADQYFGSIKSVMDALKKQNEGLMKRVEELEQRVKQSGGTVISDTASASAEGAAENAEALVPRSSLDAYITQNEDLTARLERSEKGRQRLLEIFRGKTAEFNACLSVVLGLKTAWSQDGTLRVTSMFDLGTQLIFKPVDRGTWKPGQAKPYVLSAVSENSGLQGLPEMINYWVREQNCVPALVASVTLECYEKMKREGRERGELEMFVTADPAH